jgi:SNF2 family DNA or RNA helicase
MYKVPIFIDLAEEALDSKYSVVIFVNYIETMNLLAHHLKTDCLIHGEQKLDERQSCIDDFQENRRNVLIAIMQAGGVGISLHDIHGGHPRMSLISPTWTGQDIKQALGRIHRAGSKSPALQKIVYCAGTYEDKLCQIIADKINTISAINDGDMLGPQFDREEYIEIAENVDHATYQDPVINIDQPTPPNVDTDISTKKNIKKK